MVKPINLTDNQRQQDWESLCKGCGVCCPTATLDVVLDGELIPNSCGYDEYIYGPAPVHLDWSMLSKHEPGRALTPKDIIAESVLWKHR